MSVASAPASKSESGSLYTPRSAMPSSFRSRGDSSASSAGEAALACPPGDAVPAAAAVSSAAIADAAADGAGVSAVAVPPTAVGGSRGVPIAPDASTAAAAEPLRCSSCCGCSCCGSVRMRCNTYCFSCSTIERSSA
eukprot:101009-Chlamydomonas_euryale.AAC.1